MYESLCVLSIFDVHKLLSLRYCWKWKFSLTRLSPCRQRWNLFDKHSHEKNNFSPLLSLLMPVLRGLGRMTKIHLRYSLTSISPHLLVTSFLSSPSPCSSSLQEHGTCASSPHSSTLFKFQKEFSLLPLSSKFCFSLGLETSSFCPTWFIIKVISHSSPLRGLSV